MSGSNVDKQTVLGFQFEPNRRGEVSTQNSGLVHYDEGSCTNASLNSEANRLESLEWCACGNCGILPTQKECLCCKEMEAIKDLYDSNNLSCVTHHKDFQPIVLLKGNLWVGLVSLHFNMSKKLESIEKTPNWSFRYTAYRHFCWWVHNRLGKGVRKVIPACVVKKIRAEYPEADGNYTGFRECEEVSKMEFMRDTV